ncbi:MAG TPA: hypothetical protein VGF69_12850 [Thermoanaerobaculia bacterium]|jgi:hypothetical protein
MSANAPVYVVCNNGVFILPDSVYQALAAAVPKGFVYLRQDDDILTISTTWMVESHKRVVNTRYRATMFRDATKLAIVDLKESLQIMAVAWRATTRPAPAPSGSPASAP